MASVDFLAGVAQAAGDTQLTLIPASPASSVDHVSAQQLVNNAAVDGVVIYSVAKGDPHIDAIRARGLPQSSPTSLHAKKACRLLPQITAKPSPLQLKR